MRAAYKRYFSKDDPFYSMFDISDYTFRPYKVVWPWISTEMRAAVVSTWEDKPVVPEHNTSFVDCSQKAQAHFICGLINSAAGDFAIRSYYSGGGGGIGSPRVLENIRIPKFDSQNPLHLKLAELSEKAHYLAAASQDKTLNDIQDEIDHLAGELWSLSEDAARARPGPRIPLKLSTNCISACMRVYMSPLTVSGILASQPGSAQSPPWLAPVRTRTAAKRGHLVREL